MIQNKDEIEKAVQRKVGDLHPNGKWVWTEYKPGKFDWRPSKKNAIGVAGGSSDGADKKTTATTSKTTSAKSGAKPMNSQKLIQWAATTSDDNLLKVANSRNGNAQMRMIAYKQLESRGFDMSKVDTSGTLGQLMKMVKQGNSNQTPTSSDDIVNRAAAGASVDIDDDPSEGGIDDSQITEKWYLNKNDDRVKKRFNLKTKEGRIKYDQFVYKEKKKEPDYKAPVEVIQDLNEQYLEFLDNPEQRFMISAGGAGIGKSYGFNKIAELLNMKPFEEGDQPGDDDYNIFEAPDVTSGKQLLSILKAHNGKIIVFDDNDKVLRRADCASVMKKATATTGKRIVGDPDDIKSNFEFTGRIIIMTNKDLNSLAESEDVKAIISRAMMVSEIYLTVPEQIEVMKSRYQDYEFKQAPRLDDEAADKKERDEIMSLIEKNQKNIDPIQFTIRTFQEILINKRKVDNANEKRNNPAFAAMIGSKQKDWKKVALDVLTKAAMNDFEGDAVSDELVKAENLLINKAYAHDSDDGVNYHIDDPEDIDVEKAENLLLNDGKEDVMKANGDEMSISEAEEILLGL